MAMSCGLLLLGAWFSGHLKAECSRFHTLLFYCMWDKGKASLGGALERSFFVRAPMGSLYWLHIDLENVIASAFLLPSVRKCGLSWSVA